MGVTEQLVPVPEFMLDVYEDVLRMGEENIGPEFAVDDEGRLCFVLDEGGAPEPIR